MSDYRKYFTAAVERNYPSESAHFLRETNEYYRAIAPDIEFRLTSGNPIDKRLDFCAYFLALIKTLDRHGKSFDEIERVSLEVVTAYVQPKNKIHAYIKRIPPKLIDSWVGRVFLPLFHSRVSRNKSRDGFIAHIVTAKEETYGLGYGIDIIECGICKLFNKHAAGKYAPILCEVDKLTSGLAGLTLIRTGTIATGASKCDFRFRKV